VENVGTKGVTIMNTQSAESIFKAYKIQLELAVTQYNSLSESYPGSSFPTLARQIWRSGMLAEAWGIIASKLNKQGINYMENWRTGK
jgi:hypothetical protein